MLYSRGETSGFLCRPLPSGESGFPNVTGCTHLLWQVPELVLICCSSPVTEACWMWGPGSAHWIYPVAPAEHVRGMGAAVSPTSEQKPSIGVSASQFPGSPQGRGPGETVSQQNLAMKAKTLEFKPFPDSVLLTRTISKNLNKGSSKTVHGPEAPEFHVWKCGPLKEQVICAKRFLAR